MVDPCDDDAGAKDGSTDASDDAEGGPPSGDGGSDAQADASPAACPGACIPAPPLDWSEIVLLSVGPMGTAPPACPPEAPVVGFQGLADLVAPPASCGACACGVATATCALPPSMLASTVANCQPGGVTTSFDPPAAWDGTCTNDNAIVQGQMCGGVVCVKSLEVGPLAILNEACAAVAMPAPPTPPLIWQTTAIACKRGSAVSCQDPMLACAPVEKAPAGFALCVHQAGDLACPESFPDKHLVAAGADDQRACTSCACGAPSGGECKTFLNVYADDTCAAKPPPLRMEISSAGSACHTFPSAGPALLSKSTDEVKYNPGSCAPSGGVATGQAVPVGTATFCCRP